MEIPDPDPRLSESDRMLVRNRDLFFGSSWERMREALKRELEGKPYARVVGDFGGVALGRIRELEKFEEENGVDLHDYL